MHLTDNYLDALHNPGLHLIGLRFENLGLREQVNVELLCKLVAFRAA